jgi:hypothetical protein
MTEVDPLAAEIASRLMAARNRLEHEVEKALAAGHAEYAKGLRRGWDAATKTVNIQWEQIGFRKDEEEQP